MFDSDIVGHSIVERRTQSNSRRVDPNELPKVQRDSRGNGSLIQDLIRSRPETANFN
jgi:hypothetical protein